MARVPQFPGALRVAGQTGTSIRAANPVKGIGEWYDMANAQAWLAGRGAQLVSLGPYIGALGSSTAFACTALPHIQLLNWIWMLSLARTSSAANVFGHFVGAGGTTLGTWQLDSSVESNTPQHFYFVESFAAAAITETMEFYPEVNTDSTSTAVDLVGLSCTELPMYAVTTLGTAETEIVEPATCQNGAPIFDLASVTRRESVSGLMRVCSDLGSTTGLIHDARRCMLFSWAHPDGVEFTTTSFVSLFVENPSVLARHLFNAVTVGTVRLGVFAAAVGGDATGEVRFTATSGDTETLSIAGAEAWFYGELDVDTEEVSRNATDGGIRDGVRDAITVEARCTGTTTSLFVASVFIMEGEGALGGGGAADEIDTEGDIAILTELDSALNTE